MRSLGYEVVFLVLAIIAVALIWSLINEWMENRARKAADRSRRKKETEQASSRRVPGCSKRTIDMLLWII
jgi:hypothetical protein